MKENAPGEDPVAGRPGIPGTARNVQAGAAGLARDLRAETRAPRPSPDATATSRSGTRPRPPDLAGVSWQASSTIVSGLVRMVQQQADIVAPAPAASIREVGDDGGGGVLGWLRDRLDPGVADVTYESRLTSRLGPDLFGIRRPPPEPAHLAGADVHQVPADRVAALLAALSLTRVGADLLAPSPAELAPGRLVAGPVSPVRPGTGWGVPGAPALRRGGALPHVVHGSWIGGTARGNGLLPVNFGAAARHYAGRLSFVVWTDLTRDEVSRALAAPHRSDRAAGIVAMMNWAREHGVSVVSVNEVFHTGAPMRLNDQYAGDMAELLPHGYSAATDRLRLEILTRFGGAYVDGGHRFVLPGAAGPAGRPLEDLFGAVARSELVLALSTGAAAPAERGVIVAPARHPALLLWRELDRQACSSTQEQLFGPGGLARRRAGAAPQRLRHRSTGNRRTGQVDARLMQRLGLRPGDPRLVPVSGVTPVGHTPTWTGSGSPVRRIASSTDDITGRTARVISALVRRMTARPGNLQLITVAPVVMAMPDPDAVWIAIVRFLAILGQSDPRLRATSVTRFRWADDGSPHYLGLPAEAEALIEPVTAGHDWFTGGSTPLPGEPAWVLDEAVTPIRLLSADRARAGRARGREAAARAVVTTADWLPDGLVGVELAGHHQSAWATDAEGAERRVVPEDVALQLTGAGAPGTTVLLRMTGGPENGRTWFAARLSALLRRPVLVILGRSQGHSGGHRQEDGHDRPGELPAVTDDQPSPGRTVPLTTGPVNPAPWPDLAPHPTDDPADKPTEDVAVPTALRRVLPWLRRLTTPELYTTALERELSVAMGPDPYRLRARPPRPPWLTLDPALLPAGAVAPFLRWLDLAQLDQDTATEPPDQGELGVRLMRGETGPVSTVTRDRAARTWSSTPGAPELPATGELPHLVHVVRLGGPLPADDPAREAISDAARQYAGQVDFVLWVDITRADVAEALADPASPPGGRAARIRSMLGWARENGVLVVHLGEVLHAEQSGPALWEHAAAESATGSRPGLAVAAWHLRTEIVTLLGGASVPAGDRFAGSGKLTTLFGQVARSATGFTLSRHDPSGTPDGLGNGVLVAPAGHPAPRLLREIARLRYRYDEPGLYGGVRRMTRRFIGTTSAAERHPAVRRTADLHDRLLRALDLDITRLIDPAPTVEHRPLPPPSDETPRLTDIITVLARDTVTRRGNLHLTQVAPLVRRLPDPDAAWVAVLTWLTGLGRSGAISPITSVTDACWTENGELETVLLPAEAEALIERRPSLPRSLGEGLNRPGQPVWLLDESVEPAWLRPSGDDVGARPAPRVVTADGVVTGLDYQDTPSPHPVPIPAGHVLVRAYRWCGSPWTARDRITPETMAGDLIAAGLHERPVLIVTVRGARTTGGAAEAGLGDFASRLASLTGTSVLVVENPQDTDETGH
ncbi:hypothetical protein KIH74_12885 [Kineosporia sp. J2-2]|uniref:Uncharacterized protein n=1 Tax=Kineosporia corallincola TaxID=2835133 RepID=A0ABS5TFJ7_9ACTN|nr:hypothetical protein [Kineosporia corallincola]MBT0769825.1 hypothetical protein [Kineosporia corallincola]